MDKLMSKEKLAIEPSLAGLEYLFHPKSVAIVGVSANNWAGTWLKLLLDLGFASRIYPVNPKLNEVMGLKVYPSVRDIPDVVDYVIISTPAQTTPQVVEDCAAKGVKIAHLYTAGFTESGEEEGKRLEAELVEIARRSGMRIVGPNCMGVHCPSGHLSWRPDLPRESGAISFLSQSGWNAVDLLNIGKVRGFHFGKVVSYGNACDLDEADFLRYFAVDPDTRIIAVYIEGVKKGQRFLTALREATRVKPVVVLKGGRSGAGTRAAASHTGSLVGTEAIWDSVLKQCGAIRVYNLDEFADTLLALAYLPPPRGRSVAVIGSGGGPSVQAADDCESAGLSVPQLPLEIIREMEKFTPSAGTSLKNPIDSPLQLWGPGELYQATKVIAACPEIALLIVHIGVDFFLIWPEGRKQLREMNEAIIGAGRETSKPVAVVLRSCSSAEGWQAVLETQGTYNKAGFPVYPSIARAAQAISKLLQARGNM